jgi:hypothetical protein
MLMRSPAVLFLLLVLVSLSTGQHEQSPALASLIEAEGAFARTSVEIGIPLSEDQ